MLIICCTRCFERFCDRGLFTKQNQMIAFQIVRERKATFAPCSKVNEKMLQSANFPGAIPCFIRKGPLRFSQAVRNVRALVPSCSMSEEKKKREDRKRAVLRRKIMDEDRVSSSYHLFSVRTNFSQVWLGGTVATEPSCVPLSDP